MSATPTQNLRGHSLLAVFAHPDDESLACGGLLAWCSALDARTSLLCLTHGEHEQGDGTARPTGAPPLAEVRARELREAADILGLDDVTILDDEDGMLPWVDEWRIENDILRAIQFSRPDVVITFDKDGLYWHPDHLAVHERTTAAVATIRDHPPALYYVTMPAGAMRTVVNHAVTVTAKRDPHAKPPRSILGVADADAFGALAAPATLVVKTGGFARQKLRALQCHHSQLKDDALTLVDGESAPRLLGIECYRRAPVGAHGDTFLEQLLP